MWEVIIPKFYPPNWIPNIPKWSSFLHKEMKWLWNIQPVFIFIISVIQLFRQRPHKTHTVFPCFPCVVTFYVTVANYQSQNVVVQQYETVSYSLRDWNLGWTSQPFKNATWHHLKRWTAALLCPQSVCLIWLLENKITTNFACLGFAMKPSFTTEANWHINVTLSYVFFSSGSHACMHVLF